MVRNRAGAVLCIAITALWLAGCQSSEPTQETAKAQEMEAKEMAAPEEDGSITGQVTAVNGQEITLALGTMPQRGAGGPDATGERPERSSESAFADGQEPPAPPEGTDGQEPPALPEGADGQEPPELPDGADGQERPAFPDGADGQVPPDDAMGKNGAGRGGLELTGEEQTIRVSDATKYTIETMGESSEASIGDIEEGSILKVVMDGDTAASITIRKMEKRNTDSETETGI